METLEPTIFGKILEYYAILCLAFMPVNIVLMIFLSRRTNILDKIDELVDRIIPPRSDKTPVPTGDTKDQQSATTTKESPQSLPSEEEIRRMSGISSFEILVGETYRCHLNFQNRGGSYGEMVWYNDNQFVGKISENGVFKGYKVGQSNIFCASKNSMYNSETQAYCINVVSRLGAWFADEIIAQVSSRTPRVDIITKNIRRRILREHPQTNILEYAGVPTEKSNLLSYQFSETGILLRAYYRLQATPPAVDLTVSMLQERFHEIKMKVSDGFRIWTHQIIDNEHEEVDIYALLKQINDNEYILAFGQNWRDYGEKEEFADNIGMAVRLFGHVFDTDKLSLEAEKEQPEEAPVPAGAVETNTNEHEPNITDGDIEYQNEEVPDEDIQEDDHQTNPDNNGDDVTDDEVEATLDDFENFTDEEHE